MAFKISCSDTGQTCDFVAEGKTKEEALVNMKNHHKAVHGATDDKLNEPTSIKNMMDKIVEIIDL